MVPGGCCETSPGAETGAESNGSGGMLRTGLRVRQGTLVEGCDPLRGAAVGPGRGDEDGVAVVPQLLDRVPDVVEGVLAFPG